MSFTIDSKIYRANHTVKYGDSFPKPFHSQSLWLSGIGGCNVYITKVGHPEWSNDFSVKMEIFFYITEVFEPEKGYIKNSKTKIKKEKPKLRLIK